MSGSVAQLDPEVLNGHELAAASGAVRVLAWPGLGARAQNPYTSLLYTHLERLGVRVQEFSPGRALRGGYDILHVHWPDKALDADSWAGRAIRAVAARALVGIARLRGAHVVWTAHNAEPHESTHPALERWFWSGFVRQVDAVLHPSAAGQRAVETRYPALARLPHAVVAHGHFRGAYPDTIGRDEARARFAIPAGARVLAFVGRVREYKNVPHLVRTMRALPPDAGDLVLLIAGAPQTPKLAAEIRAAAADDPRVRLQLQHVPEVEVQSYLRAADLVVLPFTEITNSGSAVLALSFDRPVLVPALGAMGELRQQVGTDWVHTYQGELTPDTLAAALHRAALPSRQMTPRLEDLEWPLLARQTLALYHALVRR
ncbi:MAG TPA: glycosyltransferase [Gemmatimonadales bacterium]|jgi:glycosyltransferase involved in cell wall biosynthesis